MIPKELGTFTPFLPFPGVKEEKCVSETDRKCEQRNVNFVMSNIIARIPDTSRSVLLQVLLVHPRTLRQQEVLVVFRSLVGR
jgi:hypothetical protein